MSKRTLKEIQPGEAISGDEANSLLAQMIETANAAKANESVGIEEAEAAEANTPEGTQAALYDAMRTADDIRYGISGTDATDAEIAAQRMKAHEAAKTCKNAATWIDEPDEPDDPLIDGLIEVGAMFAIVGPAKAAKSWLAEQFAVCVATGRDFFGRRVKRQRVYVANIEVSPKQYKKRLRSISRRMGISRSELDGWLFVDNLRGKTATWEWCFDEAKMRGAQLVIIDPFYQIFNGKETDEADCQKAVEEMKKFLKEGFTLCIVFHAPKGKPGDREIVDMISGSSVLVRFPENVIAILPHATEKDARVVDCSVLRDYPPPDPFAVKFDDGALVLAPEITPELKSGSRHTPRKSQDEKDAERVKHHNEIIANMTETAKAFVVRCGANMPNTKTFSDELRKSYAKPAVADFVSSVKNGSIEGLVAVEEDRQKRKAEKKKGPPNVFITTPERAKEYDEECKRITLGLE